MKSWMCFTEKGCCQCIARLRKRAKPWRQGCPVGEWCRIRKLLRKQAKPTRQGRPVGAAMCRRGSQIPCASPQQSKVKMAPTRKCRTWSWDVSFSQNSQAAATRTCMRRGAMASLRQHVKMPPESVQKYAFSTRARGIWLLLPAK